MLVQRSLLALGLGAVLAGAGVAAAESECPPSRPVLSGPSVAQAGQRYTVSWSNVLGEVGGAADYYTVERSLDGAFAAGVDRVRSSRSSLSFTAPGAPGTLYHRVVVTSSCPTMGLAVNASNVVPVKITTDCLPPDSLGDLVVTPEAPPGFTTYVVAWDTSGMGPGAGGGPSGLRFRIRRVAPFETRESVSESGSISFTDPPGEYVYQVRAEASCGALGPWSSPKRVVVGNAPGASLVLLSEPKPIAAVAPEAPPTTPFIVRNGGTKTLNIKASFASGPMQVSPESFTIGPNQAQTLIVTLAATALPSGLPVHGAVELSGDGAYLKVPVDAAIAAGPVGGVAGGVAAPAAAPVFWNDGDLDVNASGDEVLRSIVNPQLTAATIVSSIRVPWIAIESLDGETWDRPLRPLETRTVRVKVDRGARRAVSGTEVGVVSLVTAGAGEAQKMVIVDDGPRLSFTAGDRPIATGARTRILYASIPNARTASGDGRFTSDLWLTNMDVVSSIDVSIYITPHRVDGSPAETRRVDLSLAPGETRRYRNIVGAAGFSGACEMEVRSTSPTLSATALVNKLTEPVAARSPLAGSGPAVGLSEFEMRPVQPGQGVSAADPSFVLSGLRHDAKRSTSILLTETTGNDTKVRVRLFRSIASNVPILKDGRPFDKEFSVLALGTLPLNDEDLFDSLVPDGVYALVDFVQGVNDGFGTIRGAVVPMATVVSLGTGKAALRVGASKLALNPLPVVSPENGASSRTALATLPFGGGPAPLVFPVVHARGAPLTTGLRPNWRTRLSVTNVSEDQQREVSFKFIDPTGQREPLITLPFPLGPKTTIVYDDVMEDIFRLTVDENVYGIVMFDTTVKKGNVFQNNWESLDVQTETYTAKPGDEAAGDLATGMEAFSYLHGYASFQSNLGSVQLEGAESSSRYRTNLVLQEVGGKAVTVAVSAYRPGSFVPIALASVRIPDFGYISKELFKGYLGLDLTDLTDVRVVVRQIDGDGVFMAFASRINLTTGDPANVFLRPASAGTGR